MAVTLEDINKFHRFAVERIEHANHGELTIDDLVIEWESCSNRDEINIAIAEGIADVDAGRTRPVSEVNEALKVKYNLGK